jgi:hypothetical protein
MLCGRGVNLVVVPGRVWRHATLLLFRSAFLRLAHLNLTVAARAQPPGVEGTCWLQLTRMQDQQGHGKPAASASNPPASSLHTVSSGPLVRLCSPLLFVGPRVNILFRNRFVFSFQRRFAQVFFPYSEKRSKIQSASLRLSLTPTLARRAFNDMTSTTESPRYLRPTAAALSKVRAVTPRGTTRPFARQESPSPRSHYLGEILSQPAVECVPSLPLLGV